jgi:hypothetical protein
MEHTHGTDSIGLREKKEKLLSAVPKGLIAGTHDGAQFVGQMHERCVPDDMAEVVIDHLEVIDVEHQEREGLVVAHRVGGHLGESLVERAAVRQAGQAVGGRALFGGPQLVVEEPLGARTVEDGFDLRDENGTGERLGEIVDGACLDTPYDVRLASRGAQKRRWG